MSRLVSAEEARKLLDGIGVASWHRCGANDGQCSCRLIWGDRAMVAKALSCEDKTCDGDGYTVEAAHRNADLIAAAPNLAATVIALTDERDRLMSIRDDLVTDLGRQHAKLREQATYHTFAQRIATLVAPPDAVDVAVTHLAPSDLDALAETVADTLANLRISLAETKEVATREATICARVCADKAILTGERDEARRLHVALRSALDAETGKAAPAPWVRNDIDPKREGIAWYRRWEADGSEPSDDDTEQTRVAWVRHDPEDMTTWCWEIEAPLGGVFVKIIAHGENYESAYEALEACDEYAEIDAKEPK